MNLNTTQSGSSFDDNSMRRNLSCGFGFAINAAVRCGLPINANVETHLKQMIRSNFVRWKV
jgi:hypothetical protein